MLDLGEVTLAQLEELAARASAAVRVLDEARALLGGRLAMAPPPPSPQAPAPRLDPHERAEREALLARIRGTALPPDEAPHG